MEIARSIFREYDIRGIYPKEINENVIEQIAKAISIKCIKNNISEICVGRDGRLSGESLLNSLSNSLSSYGINVINIELPPLRKRENDITYLSNHFLSKNLFYQKRI